MPDSLAPRPGPTNGGVLVVTGGGRGIGAAAARKAAAAGWAVCVNYVRDRDAAERVVDAIEADGGRARAVRADVGVEGEVVALFEAADRLGPLGGLVNNAAVLDTQMRLADMRAARIERILRTNVLGSLLCAREAIRRLASSKGGRGGVIVNVSSIASRFGSPGEYVDYAASKGAIDTFTVGLAKEVAADGIRVASVRPGFVDTEIHTSGGEPDRIRRVEGRVPLGRAGTADEIADAVLWLLSDEASYVTGAILDVAGGL